MKKYIVCLLVILVTLAGLVLFKSKNKNTKTKDSYQNTTIEESKNDTSAIEVENDTNVIKEEITKTGDSSDLSLSDRNGLNSAVLVNKDKSVKIEDSTIKTSGSGSSGVAATVQGASVTVSNTTIETSGERSKGLLASNQGEIEASNISITTTGDRSSGAVTDTNGGKLNIVDSEIHTSGAHSSGVYSTGEVTVKNSKITTENSSAAVIDGDGIFHFVNTDLTSGGEKAVYFHYTGTYFDEKIKPVFTMTRGSITAKNGPIFYITNTQAKIELTNVELNATNGILLKTEVEQGKSSRTGKEKTTKGGDVVMSMRSVKTEGEFLVDDQSTLALTLYNGTVLKSAINKDNTAKEVKLTLRSGSTLELTANCYVDKLEVESGATVIENGFKIIQK